MRTTSIFRVLSLSMLAAVLVIAATACGDDESQSTDSTASSGVDPTGDVIAENSDEETAGDELAAVATCLEDLGVSTAVGDEASTGLSPDMMANFGIDAILTFDKGAGWGGTVEVYASSPQADIAEEGYIDSAFDYEVGRVGDIVFKTTGPAEDLTEIQGCISG